MDAESDNEFDIAIVGIAGRFPGASNIEQFWDNIKNKKVSNSSFSKDELIDAGIPEEQVNDPDYVPTAPVLDKADEFDAAFFGYSPKEAILMDPQQRLLLEVGWQALESSGFIQGESSDRVATFAGTAINTYMLKTGLAEHFFNEYLPTLLGGDKDYTATRLAFKLGLTGPALTVQSACSTSLVATHLACQSLFNHECDAALVGAAAIRTPLKTGHLYQEGSVFSSDGVCRPFDNSASGTVFGSGAGAMVLRRKSDAEEDGQEILAVIKGSAINNDGNTKSDFTAPTINKQAEVVVDAYTTAGISPATINYVEAHGTGTFLGDPIEIEALTRAFKLETAKLQFCGVGSVKSNIGHLDVAAGMASIIKVVMALREETIPPTANYDKPNSQIDFQNSPFYVSDVKRTWDRVDESTPLRAGVTSLGMGGTNAHIILERASDKHCQRKEKLNRPYILPFSAKTIESLEKTEIGITEYIGERDFSLLDDAEYTLQQQRQVYNHRKVLVVSNIPVSNKINLSSSTSVNSMVGNSSIERSVVFMFPGQGSQFVNMAKDLYFSEPVFSKVVNDASEQIKNFSGIDLLSILFVDVNEDTIKQINQTQYTQPILFIIEYAYAKLYESWGVHASYYIGHSIGEYVAACLTGVLSFDDALKVVVERGRIMQAAETGAMLSVPLCWSDCEAYIGKELDIGVINSEHSTVVSGSHEKIDKLSERLSGDNIQSTLLKTSHAFHSRLMSKASDLFAQYMNGVSLSAPKIPFISNVTGDFISDSDACSGDYWAKQLRSTVQFSKGIETLFTAGEFAFLECGPSTTLSQIVNTHSGNKEKHIGIPASRHVKSDISDCLIASLAFGRLWAEGVSVDLKDHSSSLGRHRYLPPYQFSGERYWYEREPKTVKETSDQVTLRSTSKERWLWTQSWRTRHDYSSPDDIYDKFISINHDVNPIHAQWNELAPKLGRKYLSVNDTDNSEYKTFLAADGELGVLFSFKAGHDASEVAHDIVSHVKYISEHHNRPVIFNIITCGLSGLSKTIPDDRAHAVTGLIIALSKEFVDIKFRVLDISTTDTQSNIEAVVSKIKTNPMQNDEIHSYHGESWFFRSPARFNLPLHNHQILDKKLNVVVIGAFGGIGRYIAEHYAGRCQNLILTSSAFPEEASWDQLCKRGRDLESIDKIQYIRKIRTVCENTDVLEVDVSNADDVKSIFDKAASLSIDIDYVINLAGRVHDGLTLLKTQDEFMSVLKPKIVGTENLLKFQDRYGKLVLFSSIGGWLGSVGQADYSAANSFQLGVADSVRFQSNTNIGKVLALGWPGVNGVGMFSSMQESVDKNKASRNSIEINELIDMLESLIAQDASGSIVISPISIDTLLEESIRSTAIDAGAELDNEVDEEIQTSENIVRKAWSKALGVKKFEPTDNFYALGGNSLMITQIIANIRKAHSISIGVSSATENPLFSDWVRLLDSANQNIEIGSSSQSIQSKLKFDITPSIYRFLERRKSTGVNQWNLATMLRGVGKFDLEALKASIRTLVFHHDMLRASVDLNDERPYFSINTDKDYMPLEIINLEESPRQDLPTQIETHASRIQSSLNLSGGELFKVVLFECAKQDRLLLFTHHFISDGLSWTITLQDFQKAYISEIENTSGVLDDKTLSYSHWVDLLKENASRLSLSDNLRDWKNIDVSKCAKDKAGPNVLGNTNKSAIACNCKLSAEYTTNLLKHSTYGYGISELGLLGLHRSIAIWKDVRLVGIDVLNSGRDVLTGVDVSRTVGFFNTYTPVFFSKQSGSCEKYQLESDISNIRKYMKKDIEHDLFKYFSDQQEVNEAFKLVPEAPYLFNYIGQLKDSNNRLLDERYFSLAEESVGLTHDPNALRDHQIAVRLELVDDELQIAIVYSDFINSREEIEELSNIYINELKDISNIHIDSNT